MHCRPRSGLYGQGSAYDPVDNLSWGHERGLFVRGDVFEVDIQNNYVILDDVPGSSPVYIPTFFPEIIH